MQDLSFEALDPKLRSQYAKVYQAIDELDRWPTRKDEVFAYRALLVNVSSQDHVDSSDWNRGIAGLMAAGDFEG